MASNTFGNQFRITTFGESHGKAIGVVIDGIPAGIAIDIEAINQKLALRAPGRNAYLSPRKEPDIAILQSGVFEGKSTGAPLTLLIENKAADSSKYEPIKDLLRPGHANFTYLEKYGVFDYRGGGRSSARETAARVAASAISDKILAHFNIEVFAYLKAIGNDSINPPEVDSKNFNQKIIDSPIFCPCKETEVLFLKNLEAAKKEGESLGGVVEFAIKNCPIGLGEPIYEKIEARLAFAMMSIPASKGFEIGEGFNAAKMKGSFHNDIFGQKDNQTITQTNHAGGILGGISNGNTICGRVAFKPTSSIFKAQQTLDTSGNEKTIELPKGSKHDPCLSIRAVRVVEAMCSLTIADLLLMKQTNQLEFLK